MKRLFRLKYPKLTLLILCTFAAYYIFTIPIVFSYLSGLKNIHYLAIFGAGLLFSFGFTTPLAIGFFISINPPNILLSALIGGFGALIADLFIFNIIKMSFMDEFKKLEKSKPLKNISTTIKTHTSAKIKNYLIYIFAGIIIASPLPDEIGVTMLAGLTQIKQLTFSIISLLLNSLGILVFLLI